MDHPITVLHVLDELHLGGGVQAMLMNLYRHIDRRRVQFHFLAYSLDYADSYADEIRALGGAVFALPSPGAVGSRRYLRQFAAFLAAQPPYDAVHAHNIHHNGLILLAARRAGIPLRISHSHQTIDDRRTTLVKVLAFKIMQVVIRQQATALVACSTPAGQFLYGPRARFSLFPNAIDRARFARPDDPTAIARVRQELAIPPGSVVLGHLGRFCYPKNHRFLVPLLQAWDRQHPAWVLLLIGDGEGREEIAGLFRAAGLADRVRFLGVRHDVHRLYPAMDLFLLPSLSEGLPVAVVEAQAAGTPCLLSTRITREVDMGLGLVTFLPLEAGAAAWAAAAARLLAAPPAVTDTQVARAFAEQGFDSAGMVRRIYQLYGIPDAAAAGGGDAMTPGVRAVPRKGLS